MSSWTTSSLLEARLRQVSAKSKLAEALRYALGRWNGLTQFLDDGRVDLDTNTVERSIRPIALNRKNALFAGSDEGGDNWAVIATLIENCKLSGVTRAPRALMSHGLDDPEGLMGRGSVSVRARGVISGVD